MISLQKNTLAAELNERLHQYAERYADLSARNEPIPDSIANAYRARDIKLALRIETNDKCAYCESKIPHVDYGDVEHIIPKSSRPDLRFDYLNLTYSCAICNNKKGNYYDPELPLLNPFSDDPSEHLDAFGPMIMRKINSDRGLLTQLQLELNRTELCERRLDRLEKIQVLIERQQSSGSLSVRRVLLEQLEEECNSDKEYSLVVRSYIEATRARLAP